MSNAAAELKRLEEAAAKAKADLRAVNKAKAAAKKLAANATAATSGVVVEKKQKVPAKPKRAVKVQTPEQVINKRIFDLSQHYTNFFTVTREQTRENALARWARLVVALDEGGDVHKYRPREDWGFYEEKRDGMTAWLDANFPEWNGEANAAVEKVRNDIRKETIKAEAEAAARTDYVPPPAAAAASVPAKPKKPKAPKVTLPVLVSASSAVEALTAAEEEDVRRFLQEGQARLDAADAFKRSLDELHKPGHSGFSDEEAEMDESDDDVPAVPVVPTPPVDDQVDTDTEGAEEVVEAPPPPLPEVEQPSVATITKCFGLFLANLGREFFSDTEKQQVIQPVLFFLATRTSTDVATVHAETISFVAATFFKGIISKGISVEAFVDAMMSWLKTHEMLSEVGGTIGLSRKRQEPSQVWEEVGASLARIRDAKRQLAADAVDALSGV